MRRSIFYFLIGATLAVIVLACVTFRTVFTAHYIFSNRLVPFVTARKGILEVAYNHRTLTPTPTERGFALATYEASARFAAAPSVAGFSFYRLSEGWLVAFPIWLIPIPLGVVAWRLRTPLRSSVSNVCGSCGYDLRATPHRCPECGAGSDIGDPAAA